ncbi:MAG TPA: hypothetical protein DD376_05600 [Sutterella sp.]|nr:hypothetical protein [Sutterella sp.]
MDQRPTRLDYFETPAGKTDCAWQVDAFARFATLSVPCALQLGVPAVSALSKTKAALKILACDRNPMHRNAECSLLLCEETAVPLQTESVDLVLWPHGLDRHSDNAAVLSEITRLLTPEGLVIVTFFNRNGVWSLRQKFSLGPTIFPDDIYPCTVTCAKEQLTRAGLTVQGGAFGVYGINHKAGALEKTALELAGDRWWPVLANLVILVAKKRVSGMTLIGKTQFTKPKLSFTNAVTAGNTNKEAL